MTPNGLKPVPKCNESLPLAGAASSGRFQGFQVLHVPYGHLERENKELPKKLKEEEVIFEPSRQAEFHFLKRRVVKKRAFYGQEDRKP